MHQEHRIDRLLCVFSYSSGSIGQPWLDELRIVQGQLGDLDQGSTTAPVGLGVTFWLPAPTFADQFVAGPHGARFHRKGASLDLVYGLPEHPPSDERAALLDFLDESVTVAEAWGRRTKRAPDGLPEVRALLVRLRITQMSTTSAASASPRPATASPVTVRRALLDDLAEPPWLRATPEHGEAWDDPSEDLLFELLTDIEDGDAGTRLTVTRLGDSSGATFARVQRRDDGRYDVEHRDGGPERWTAIAEDMGEAHELLTAWSFDLPARIDETTWTREGVEAAEGP